MASFFFVNGGQSIQAAIDNALAGDTIMVGTGVYNENLIINKKLNIISLDGAITTVINGTVSITAGEVDFGDTNHGFTVNPGAADTAAISLGAVANVHIEGNTLNGNATAANTLTTYDLFGSGGASTSRSRTTYSRARRTRSCRSTAKRSARSIPTTSR